jgi:hypothetical protein
VRKRKCLIDVYFHVPFRIVYAILEVRNNQEGLKMNGTHVNNIKGGNINVVRKEEANKVGEKV